MCGIAGQICREGEQAEELLRVYKNMQAEMLRRGPDQSGMYFDGEAALIHSRLCVVDPENGLQPMTLKRGGETYTVVYNGELYNTDELRDDMNFQLAPIPRSFFALMRNGRTAALTDLTEYMRSRSGSIREKDSFLQGTGWA